MSVITHPQSAATYAGEPPIRVMIVDDAVVVRGLVSRWLSEEAGIEVVGVHRTGREAVNDVLRSNPDVVILDIEMPELDGISALPLLLEKKRDLVVLMASTLTRHGAEISMKALSLGAADYIPKPESNREVTTSQVFRRELVDKIRMLGRRRRRFTVQTSPRPVAAPSIAPGRPAGGAFTVQGGQAPARPHVHAAPIHHGGHGQHAPIRLRPWAITAPRVLLIGSSTGGPQALQTLLRALGGVTERLPVLIVQHMPRTFTTILAEHIATASGRPAHEARHGEPIKPGTIYVAPGGQHMIVDRRSGAPCLMLEDSAPVNFCKPAVDPMFASAAAAYGAGCLAVVLTGMGADGAHGAADVVAAGGSVIAQDEATSVVWGMPGATANAGVCSAVLPLDQIAPRIIRLMSGDRS